MRRPSAPWRWPDDQPGEGLFRLDLIGTGAFTVTAAAGAALDGAARYLAAAVALVLFAAGIALFLVAYWRAVQRSRTDSIGIGGLYFLASSAPRGVQWRFMGLLGAQVVVGVATASARPFTSLAFGILVPMFGLAVAGVWGARYGRFGPRPARPGTTSG